MEVMVGFDLWIIFIMGATMLSVGGFAFWIWMLIHCIQKEFNESHTKLVWVTLLLWLNVFGAILYFFLEKDKNDAAV